ncbi:CIC11C00000003877 [Sungouiella intermedia]|uniref:Indoleamine 2,3-dioxygenase n=1 Tax=Sungouiella intermedia TaxID=45354 RepID=A0A1L0DFX0_9ASCO|nr:CIC11C00000003877 [[Candida] intermedia]
MLDLQDFDVSPTSGFLPSEYPVARLSLPYYQPWEDLVANLPALLLSRRIRVLVDKLPILSTDKLTSIAEVRRAYQVLGFLAHAYVWGVNEPTDRIPESVARPLVDTAETLGLPPLATYAGLCLWNFKEIMPTGNSIKNLDLDNLTTINTFTGSIDESWFYLVSVFFEYKGAGTIRTGVESIAHAQNGDSDKLIGSLQKLAQAIDELGTVLMRMEEMCDPHVFYFRIRPYLAGWKNMADAGLNKDGVFYGNEQKPRAYAGGSNAQSSMIQFLDSLLSVKHFSTGERPVPHQTTDSQTTKTAGPRNDYLMDMRQYMPRKHREFLATIDRDSCIRDFVMKNKENSALVLAYDACLAMLKLFRDKHIQIVTRYVVLQAKQVGKMGSLLTLRSGLAKKKKLGAEEKGTGGTSLLPFLKQCRDETGDPAAGSWGQRILSDGVMRLRYSKPNGINED